MLQPRSFCRPASRPDPSNSERGQSLVEFSLLLPILLVLLLGVADFGRIFQAGIVTESAARAAAEAGALEYLRNPPDPGRATWNPAEYYGRLHRLAAEAACAETRLLENSSYSGGVCAQWPAIAICVHDRNTPANIAGDPTCGSAATGFRSSAPGCEALGAGWGTVRDGQNHAYVEVRVCYRFTTLFGRTFSLPMNAGLGVGDMSLVRDAYFIVADY